MPIFRHGTVRKFAMIAPLRILKKFDDKFRDCKCMPQCSTGLGLEDGGLEDEEADFRK